MDKSIKPTPPDVDNIIAISERVERALRSLNIWCERYKGYINQIYNDDTTLEKKMNSLFWLVKQIGDNQIEVVEGFKELYDFVNDYFDNLDIQEEVNKKIDEMADSGYFNRLIAGLIGVTPGFAETPNDFTNKNRVYVLKTDGYIYYWDGRAWVNSGILYQATALQPITEHNINHSQFAEIVAGNITINTDVENSTLTVNFSATSVQDYNGKNFYIASGSVTVLEYNPNNYTVIFVNRESGEFVYRNWGSFTNEYPPYQYLCILTLFNNKVVGTNRFFNLNYDGVITNKVVKNESVIVTGGLNFKIEGNTLTTVLVSNTNLQSYNGGIVNTGAEKKVITNNWNNGTNTSVFYKVSTSTLIVNNYVNQPQYSPDDYLFLGNLFRRVFYGVNMWSPWVKINNKSVQTGFNEIYYPKNIKIKANNPITINKKRFFKGYQDFNFSFATSALISYFDNLKFIRIAAPVKDSAMYLKTSLYDHNRNDGIPIYRNNTNLSGKVLVIGDSWGVPGHWQKTCKTLNPNLDFVGTVQATNPSNNDIYGENYGGTNINYHFTSESPFYSSALQTFDYQTYVTLQGIDADIVVFLLGANSIDPATFKSNMQSAINSIKSYRKNVKIFAGMSGAVSIGLGDAPYNGADTYNAQIAQLPSLYELTDCEIMDTWFESVDDLDYKRSKIQYDTYVNDIELDTVTDRLHLSTAGQRKLGAFIYNYL